MNVFARKLLLRLAVTSLSGVASAVPVGVGPLTFEDQFEGTQLDLTKWQPSVPGSTGHRTLDAVEVSDETVKMKVFTTDGAAGQKIHNVGNINTSSFGVPGRGFEQTYGYFESRVRFRETTGSWSAFWLQSDTIGFPKGNPEAAGVEMDIFEHRVVNPFSSPPPQGNNPGGTAPYEVSKKIHSALIWDGYPPPPGASIAHFTPGTPAARISLPGTPRRSDRKRPTDPAAAGGSGSLGRGRIGRPRPRKGFCHRFWRTKQRILKEHFRIVWFTPQEMNPDQLFD